MKQIWGSTKRLLYPRVKHYRKKQKPGAEPDSKGLSSRQVADAETPKSSKHDTILQTKGVLITSSSIPYKDCVKLLWSCDGAQILDVSVVS